jgi:hypothetical protein
MTKKVALFALASALMAAAAGCTSGGSSSGGPTSQTFEAGATGAASSAPTAASLAGTAKAGQAQPSGGSTSASAHATNPSAHATNPSAHATNPTEHIKLSPTTTTSVVAWYHGTGGAAFTSLTKAIDQASQASASGGAAAFGKTCQQIGSTAKAAQAAPPIPVANAAGWYTSALKGYVQSAADCTQGVSTQNQLLVQQAEGEVAANNTDLNQAAAVLIAALSAGK